jgi:glycosyltransferase involved in cell wall biosynthesis
MKLVVTIPALNEQATIGKVVSDIPRQIAGVDVVQVLVMNDDSTDRTAEIASQAGAEVVTLKGRLGLGQSFRTAMRLALASGADLIVNIDGDGQFDSRDVPRLIEPILSGRADFVTCVRFKPGTCRRDMDIRKYFGNRGITWFVNRVTGMNLADVSCGFRAYSREAASRLQSFGRWTYAEECVLDLAEKQVRIEQIHLPVRGSREHGQSRVASSVLKYGRHLAQIVGRNLYTQRPLQWLGWASAGCGAASILLALIGSWSACGAACVLAGVLLTAALLGDMIARHRAISEELTFLARYRFTDPHRTRSTPASLSARSTDSTTAATSTSATQ